MRLLNKKPEPKKLKEKKPKEKKPIIKPPLIKKPMTPLLKQCLVRLTPELHRLAKVRAAEAGITLQKWVACLIEKELKDGKK